jgi:hypothetical protein
VGQIAASEKRQVNDLAVLMGTPEKTIQVAAFLRKEEGTECSDQL